MPFGTTHILVPIIIVSVIRAHWKKLKHKITLKEIFVAGFFGLLPDIDVPIWWIINLVSGAPWKEVHRVFTHSIIFVFIILFVAYLLKAKSKKLYVMGLLAAFGYATHLVLDLIIVGQIKPFWPFSTVAYGLQLVPIGDLGFSILAGIDALLILFWLWHEERFGKIKSFY